jgi:Cu/Ag efflux protein CusF
MKHWILSLALLFASSSWAATEWVRAEVIKLSTKKGQITLRHEAIKSAGMDAMTMPYKVMPDVALKNFKAGDKVRFTIRMQGDQMLVESMEHAK